MKHYQKILSASVLLGVVLAGSTAISAPKKNNKQLAPLSPAAEKAFTEYSGMLETLKAQIQKSLPQINPAKQTQFLLAHAAEKIDKNAKKKSQNNDLKTVAAARPMLADLDTFLANSTLDDQLVKAAVIAAATPRRLAEFAGQGSAEKKLIDDLLADPQLMQEMLYAGGAKDGRYWKTMQIFRSIQAASERAKKDPFRRLALGAALELAAPELCRYEDIDPVKRYLFYEKSYLDKELDPAFDKFTTWQYRHVVNDPHSEADMLWMREMLWNYRPDFITVPEGYRARYVGLMNSEFGHKQSAFDDTEATSQLQQTINNGSLCGPKAFFGRCLARSFGIPTWGARLRTHTAMAYWTPKGWTTILGVSWGNGYWIADAEPMSAQIFKMDATARENPKEYLKACRARWIGSVLGETKVDGREPGTGGLWGALSLNKLRTMLLDANPGSTGNQRPWSDDSYPKDAPKLPEQMMHPVISEADRKIETDNKGTITVPAVACASPTTNTSKIVFMKSRTAGMQLHYKRYELPETFTYEITAPKAGKYLLSAKVVTVNQDQFFMLNLNSAAKPVEFKMPYTVGKWGNSEPIQLTLIQGKNKLTFTRTAPADFVEKGWSRSGPEYGGVTIKEFTLKPVN